MRKVRSVVLVSLAALVLSGCEGGFSDLDAFMAEMKARPVGTIKPVPPFKAYKAFAYSAAGMRSPFERPIEVREITRLQMATNVKPDDNRAKEYLEQFSIDALSMVGTLEMGGSLWVLIQDEAGSVHRVRNGNFLGRNHGRIVEASETEISVIEIVSNGANGWVERPRTIKLKNEE